MGNKLVWKFIGAFIVLIFLSVFIMNFFVGLKLKDDFEQKISRSLLSNASLIGDILADNIKQSDSAFVQKKTGELAAELDVRITVIDSAGNVLGDSESRAEEMGNLSNRPEVKEAVSNGIGESSRFSETLSYNMKYVAVSIVEDKELVGIIRLSLPSDEVKSQIRVIYRVVLTGGIVAIIFVLILGYFISRSIINPISKINEVARSFAKGDFTKRITISRDDELGVMAKSLNTMADELELSINDLRKVDKRRSEFVANVSHELKTPLTSIMGFVETLEEGAIDDKENSRRFLAIIKKHAEGLSNITDDLLKLSELESGKDRIDKNRFDLKELINDVVLRYDQMIIDKHIKLTEDYNGDNLIINVDRQKIEQALVNILDNSMKYTGEGGSINVHVYENKDHILIEVEDNGIGIPEEHLDRIFERFYRVDKARSRKLGGTGLGLSIVKHAVLLHGGSVNITSKESKGTKVSVTLPKE